MAGAVRDGVGHDGGAPAAGAGRGHDRAGGAAAFAAALAGAGAPGGAAKGLMGALSERAASDPEGLEAVLRAAYGGRAAGGRGEALVARLAAGDVPRPELRLAGEELMPEGALGAYEAARPGRGGRRAGTVWLHRDLVRDPEAMARTLAEELGHHLDAQLGRGDARGDEGAVFARLVLGERLSPAALEGLRAEDDHGRLADGRRVEFREEPSADGSGRADDGRGSGGGSSGGDGYSPSDTPGERDGSARGGAEVDRGAGTGSTGTGGSGGDGHSPSDTPGERDGSTRGGATVGGGASSGAGSSVGHGYDDGPVAAMNGAVGAGGPGRSERRLDDDEGAASRRRAGGASGGDGPAFERAGRGGRPSAPTRGSGGTPADRGGDAEPGLGGVPLDDPVRSAWGGPAPRSSEAERAEEEIAREEEERRAQEAEAWGAASATTPRNQDARWKETQAIREVMVPGAQPPGALSLHPSENRAQDYPFHPVNQNRDHGRYRPVGTPPPRQRDRGLTLDLAEMARHPGQAALGLGKSVANAVSDTAELAGKASGYVVDVAPHQLRDAIAQSLGFDEAAERAREQARAGADAVRGFDLPTFEYVTTAEEGGALLGIVGATVAGGAGLLRAGGRVATRKAADEAVDTLRTPKRPRPISTAPGSTPSVPPARMRPGIEAHIRDRDFNVPRREGIGGAHNAEEFQKAMDAEGGEIVGNPVAHPSIPGIEHVRYQMPKRDHTGEIIKGEFQSRVREKTIYDPAIIPDETMMRWGREAAEDAMHANGGTLPHEWTGRSLDGAPIHRYADTATGEVTSFFVEMPK